MNTKEWKLFHYISMNTYTSDKKKQKSLYSTNIELPNHALIDTLKRLRNSIGLLYYPACGSHVVPRDTLGIEKVVHSSYEDYYFKRFGDGIKIQTDLKNEPFRDETFDAILIWSLMPNIWKDKMSEFRRIVKEGGFVIIGGNLSLEDYRETVLSLDLAMQRVPLSASDKYVIVYRN